MTAESVPLLYQSGWQSTNQEKELALIKSGWLTHRCFSFSMVQKITRFPYALARIPEAYRACVENKVGIMMDSGVISWRRLVATGHGKDLCSEQEFIDQYVDFVRANRKHWDFYLTVDLNKIGHEIFTRHTRLEEAGIRPVPVFHGDDSTDYLRRYADKGYRFIAISTIKGRSRLNRFKFRKYLDAVFKVAQQCNLSLHGLACTAPWLVLEYPFHSLDSSAWAIYAGTGDIFRFSTDTRRCSVMHVSDQSGRRAYAYKLNTNVWEALREELLLEGFDLVTLRNDLVQRHIYNARSMELMRREAARVHGNGGIGGWNFLV